MVQPHLALLFGTLLSLLGVTGCATPPVCRIATDAVFPPFHFVDAGGVVTGHDVELARQAVERAGERAHVVRVESYAALFEGLIAGRHDVVAATTGITDERRLKYGFTRPYFVTCLAVVVRTAPASLMDSPISPVAGSPLRRGRPRWRRRDDSTAPRSWRRLRDPMPSPPCGPARSMHSSPTSSRRSPWPGRTPASASSPSPRPGSRTAWCCARTTSAAAGGSTPRSANSKRTGRSPRSARFGVARPAGWPVGPNAARDEREWVTFAGADGPGRGRHIVLISGDEEYRSEEALPQLGRILAERHGFTCTVLFAIDPATGEIDPERRENIPGLAALFDADLMIIATRFRDLPDEQMAHIDAYIESGRPIIGLRTATHAFALESSPTYRRYSWNADAAGSAQGFGRQVLGETWIAHHGRHGEQSTRGVIADGAHDHPIARGLEPGTVWGPSDVYRVRLPLPGDARPIVLGQVLAGMNPDSAPVAGGPNAPMMPVAWTKTHGPRSGRVFTTTMGAATDLVAVGTRRMIVNAVYWTLGLEEQLPATGADVGLVGRYEPTPFGFGAFRRGVRPADHAGPAR